MRVLYVTPATFSVANAASLRNLGLSLALVAAGHDVTIAGADAPDAPVDPALARFTGSHLRLVAAGVAPSSRTTTDRLAGNIPSVHARLESLVTQEAPDAIILYQSFLPTLVMLRRLARARGAAFLLDITEWYDGASLPHGALGPANVLNQISMRYVVPQVSAAIAISEPLAAHCRRRGARTTVVPPVFDLDFAQRDADDRDSQPIQLALAGSGITRGQKDRLSLLAIAAAVERIDPAGRSVRVRVAGVSRRAVEIELDGQVPASFDILGRIGWEESLAVVSACDYSVLLRDPTNRRSAFGMPSKVAESLLLGTPIFGNVVGDLERYLSPHENAELVGSADLADVEATLGQIVGARTRLDRAEVRALGERHFRPEQYATALDRLLHETRDRR